MNDREFLLPDEHGYLRRWLIAGPVESPYTGPVDEDDEVLRRAGIDPDIQAAPETPSLGEAGPRDATWAIHDPGDNVFIEKSGFWHSLMHVDTWFAADLRCEQAVTLPVWLWAAGCADLYCNGEHVARNNCPRYMYPKRLRVELPLDAGINRLAVRLQVLGLRDSRYLFGVQCVDSGAPVAISRPGEGNAQGDVTSPPEAPADAPVVIERGSGRDLESRRRHHMLATTRSESLMSKPHAIHCARSLGTWEACQAEMIRDVCSWVERRPDCADFALAALLRLVLLGLVTDTERERIKEVALGFRYWPDETGSDAMCYTSENHQLLFHGCQLLAGRLWPDGAFSASGRLGRQQAEIGLSRCRDWLTTVETSGLREYNSSGYIPITVGALMNLVDGSGDDETSQRASRVVDAIFGDLADHAFEGVTIAPQGRVYREVLTPESSGTQALLSCAVDEAVISHNVWVGFVGSSPTYEPPADLPMRMERPVHYRYRRHTTDLTLYKTCDTILTSAGVPGAQAPDTDPSLDHDRELAAGLAGYQQHLWQATLGVGCHVFVNHPGEWIDFGKARPGYWYGNGVLPRTEQRKNMLLQVYNIDEEHPVPFVHAHWPRDAFDETLAEGAWHVGRRHDGFVGLWCSQPLERWEQGAAGELRAWSRQCAWVCICGSRSDHRDLPSFVTRCRALQPVFDPGSLILSMSVGSPLAWD